MASDQGYPSPTRAHMQSDAGPFYGSQHDGRNSPQDQEIADDLQLRADLSRGLAPMLGQPSLSEQQELDSAQFASQHFDHDPSDPQLHLTPDGLVSNDPQVTSPNQQGFGLGDAGQDRRQKVSRACDECRRKKIRCDAQNETDTEPCSNCKRTGVLCAFSRQPKKRGPSKNYIKHLTDRLTSLESRIDPVHSSQHQAEMQHLQQQIADEGHLGGPHQPVEVDISPAPYAGQKRNHDAFQASQNDMQELGSRLRGYPDERQQTQAPPYPPLNRQAQSQDPEIRLQQALGAAQMQPFFKYGGDNRRNESVSLPYDTEVDGSATVQDWDEDVVDEYYRLIHQTFPLLPHSKHRLRQGLSKCPVSLREAFVTALGCYMRSFPASSLRATQNYSPAIRRAAEQLAGYPFDNPASHTTGTNLVYLQTLLLMALESDNHGPANMRGQAGPSRAEWLGRAAGVAGQLEINLIRPRERFVTEGDPDSEERQARRIWWVLFILDRWHASSTADLLKLPEESVVLLPEDQILLGESTYHLARLSFVIGHLAAILTTTKNPETNVMASSNPASSLLRLTLAGEIHRFRESVESVWGSLNLVHLSYHHSHLLIKRLSPTTEPAEMIGHALKVATVLNQRQTPITPLNHHFAALAAMTLCELVDVPHTAVDAAKGLEHLSEALGLGRGLAGHQESSGWDSAIRALVLKKRRDGVRTSSGQTGEDAISLPPQFDPTKLTRYGYLTALGHGMLD